MTYLYRPLQPLLKNSYFNKTTRVLLFTHMYVCMCPLLWQWSSRVEFEYKMDFQSYKLDSILSESKDEMDKNHCVLS